MTEQVAVSRFVEFSRAEWARLRASTPLPLTEPQLRGLVSVNEPMSLAEVSAFIKDDISRWRKVIADGNITAD